MKYGFDRLLSNYTQADAPEAGILSNRLPSAKGQNLSLIMRAELPRPALYDQCCVVPPVRMVAG